MTDSPNWQICSLGKLGEIITGKTPSTKDTENFNGGIPFVKPGDLDRGGNIISTADTLSEKGFSSIPKLPAGAIMVTCIGYLGKVGITTRPSATNQQINSIIPSANVDAKYLYHYMRSMREWLERESSATTVSIINKSRFSEAPVQLPPLAEQKQIAAKLDELLAQVDTIKARLDAIPKILKRFRKSVLAAAVSGRLTEGWREENDATQWTKLTLVNICDPDRALTYGVIKLGDDTLNGVPCLRTSNVRWLRIDTQGVKKIAPLISNEYSRTILEGQEVLVNVRGTLGGVAAVPKEMNGWNVSREVAVVPVSPEKANSKFIALLIASESKQKWLTGVQKGVAYTGINIEDLRALPVDLPSKEEQTEIVRRIEELFAFADQIEQRVKDAYARVNHLTQSILAKAFRGELTADWRAQNPDLISGKNSAEALLARILAEREQQQPARRGRKVKT